MRGARVVAVVDPDRGGRERVGDLFHIHYRVTGIDAVLALRGIDAVCVAVPPERHAEAAVAALQAGKHVWIDRTLALSSGECLRILEAAEQASSTVMTRFHMRFNRIIREARARESGRHGPGPHRLS